MISRDTIALVRVFGFSVVSELMAVIYNCLDCEGVSGLFRRLVGDIIGD